MSRVDTCVSVLQLVMPFSKYVPGEDHIWDGRVSSPKNKDLDISCGDSHEASVEVLGDQLGYMNLQFTRDWKCKSRNLKIWSRY